MAWIFDPQSWLGLLTLTFLEIVLGIDNIVFISLLSGKLPKPQQPRARKVGLLLAMCMRILLLLSLTWIMRLQKPFFTAFGHPFSGRDFILIGGGLFLVGKSTREIHERLEGDESEEMNRAAPSFVSVVVQIMFLDIIFSLDSVITAVGMVQHLPIMIAAIVIAVGIMLLFSGTVSELIHRHPSIKMLALSFLLLIGFNLLAEGFGQNIPKGYVYFSMGFSVLVECLNIRSGAKSKPVELHDTFDSD